MVIRSFGGRGLASRIREHIRLARMFEILARGRSAVRGFSSGHHGRGLFSYCAERDGKRAGDG